MLKPRTKLVSFRLSAEEYKQLADACAAEGARSISEFARSALQRTVTNDQNDSAAQAAAIPFAEGTQELIDTMRELNHRLGQLVSFVQREK